MRPVGLKLFGEPQSVSRNAWTAFLAVSGNT
jgi:hypothetical protein